MVVRMTQTPHHGVRPENTDPREFRRRGIRSLRMATAAVGAAAVVGTGGIALALVEPPSAASEVDAGTPGDTSTGTPPTEAGLSAPAQAPESADPGKADASSGGS
jgi:hypothetical protein